MNRFYSVGECGLGQPKDVGNFHLMSAQEDVGMQKDCVEYMMEQVTLVKIEVASQKIEKDVGLAEASMGASYAEDHAITTF